MKFIISAAVFALIITFLFFYLGVINNFMQATVAFLVVAGISFLFTTVAANAIAIVGTNPRFGNDTDDTDSSVGYPCGGRT